MGIKLKIHDHYTLPAPEMPQSKITTMKHHQSQIKLVKSVQLIETTMQLYSQLGVVLIGDGFDDGLSETLAKERY